MLHRINVERALCEGQESSSSSHWSVLRPRPSQGQRRDLAGGSEEDCQGEPVKREDLQRPLRYTSEAVHFAPPGWLAP
jgi:hypothetical protein